ncbi:PD-(D/E)XK nuclease family protein [archaeon]|nr:PD-(D/E)XK nuclease family protein [archaeon]
MAARIQSPNSINTYKQCPRKYYYQYILKIDRKIGSIHLQRGSIAHSVLEDFFTIDISNIHSDHYEFELKVILQNLLKQKWQNGKDEFAKLDLTEDQLLFYFEETKMMVNNWFNNFLKVLKPKIMVYGLKEGFNIVKPITEMHFISQAHQVQGFVDAIHEIDGKVSVMDYKTSKREKITEEYRLQLAIYALLYQEKYGKLPHLVGVDFLRHKPHYLEVDDELLRFAKRECKVIQENTISDDIDDYSIKEGVLCRYCDFYDICFGQKTIHDFEK